MQSLIVAANSDAKGSFLVPIILGSDKTTVSVATGNNEYWPVYLSIGNIQNQVRRAHRNALVVLAFLPIAKCEPLIVRISMS
jgi:Plavaka transposase